jgi:hypothetical protein
LLFIRSRGASVVRATAFPANDRSIAVIQELLELYLTSVHSLR